MRLCCLAHQDPEIMSYTNVRTLLVMLAIGPAGRRLAAFGSAYCQSPLVSHFVIPILHCSGTIPELVQRPRYHCHVPLVAQFIIIELVTSVWKV